MSTKNLARTVIEGGRRHYNKHERRHSSAVERAHAHQLERELRHALDPEAALFRPRQPVRPDFSDKLGPAQRWLKGQVGRPWNNVRSELFERFDARTTAGRHILFCHLLEDVDVEAKTYRRFCRFFVSPAGILRCRERQHRRIVSTYQWPRLPAPEAELVAWLASRRVVAQGTRLYWLLATAHGGFRQHHELNEADAQRFRALPAWFRERFEGAPSTQGAPT